MKSHELAHQLEVLARALRQGPDVELTELPALLSGSTDELRHKKVQASLKHLLLFSRFTKQQWKDLIEQYDIPVQVKASYSARDVVGKVLSYLDSHPEALERIGRASRSRHQASPELMRAFDALLRDN